MYVHRVNNGKRIPQYTCSNYSKVPVGTLCKTQHRINADHVMELVADMIRAVIEYANIDREAFAKEIQTELEKRQNVDYSSQKKRASECEKRIGELEILIAKIYEDNALGKLSDRRYETLSKQYEQEQEQLIQENEEYKKAHMKYEKEKNSAKRFLSIVERYEKFEELSTVMLNEFIEKIVVYERDQKGKIDSPQKVDIYFNLIGQYIPPTLGDPEPTEEELEEIRKKEARREKLHQNYLKRKANGKQKIYEERVKAKRKAEIEAMKEAERAKDRENGVYYIVAEKGVLEIPRAEDKALV